MNILENVSLSNYSTMRLGGIAAYLVEVHDKHDLTEAVEWARTKKVPLVMIGGGSNIIWSDSGFPGLLVVNKIQGFNLEKKPDGSCLATIGSGEVWDEVVARTAAAGATGIEALSLIPGTAGATPIQNVGAYGQEISQTLVSVEAYDTQTNQFVKIPKSDCGFSYRTSRFKTTDRGRFLICELTLELHIANPVPPFYPVVGQYFIEHQISSYTPQTLRDAVVAIRRAKLPDPALVANTGSFFGNPIVGRELFKKIATANPTMPSWEVDDTHVKLSAAWLIEQAGFKDIHDQETGMATWQSQPLVLVNEHAHKTADLLRFKEKIVGDVQKKYQVVLQQEPELLP